MTATTTKADVERDLLAAWEALASAVDSFSDAELEVPGVVGDWTVRDLLGHIAFWAQRSVINLQTIAGGGAGEIVLPDSEAATDEWNERERRAREGRSLAEIREEWLESFEGAMRVLAAFPAEKLEEKVRGGYTVLDLFAGDTYKHYREHQAHLNAWRRELETTET